MSKPNGRPCRFFKLKFWWLFEGNWNKQTSFWRVFFFTKLQKIKISIFDVFACNFSINWGKKNVLYIKWTVEISTFWHILYKIFKNSTWGAQGPQTLVSNSSNHPLGLHFGRNDDLINEFWTQLTWRDFWCLSTLFFWQIIFEILIIFIE